MKPVPDPRRRAACLAAAILLALSTTRGLRAQVTETPAPFDSAGQVRSITPAVAARLGLAAPVWPVAGDFAEARLYAVSLGGYVIVVERRDARVDRYSLTDEQRSALQAAVSMAVGRVGRIVGEERPLVISEPARGAFIRNQMALTAFLYAPALATLTGDGTAGAAVYLFTVGASYFALTALSRQTPVTRAQNHLSTDGAVRGALMTNGLLFAFGGDSPGAEVTALATLAGGIGGAIAGFRVGQGLTDGEAKASTSGSTLLALATIGSLGTFGLLDNEDRARVVVGSAVAAALVGFPIGLRYPRRAGYTVTAGDVDMLNTAASIGVMAALTPFLTADADARTLWGAGTAGLVGGLVVGDLLLVQPYDHTEAEAAQVALGALAGGTVGAGVATLVDAGMPIASGLATLGAIAGVAMAERLVRPRPAVRRRAALIDGASVPPARRSARVALLPAGLALAGAGAPGRHAVISVRF